MSFDVYSPNASDTTLSFHRSNWGWRPLAAYVNQVAPSLAASVRKNGEPPSAAYVRGGYAGWDTNDGFGLDAPTSKALASVLHGEIAAGRAAQYVADRNARIASLPRIPCDLCGATGIRPETSDLLITDPTNLRFGQKGWCNGCDGYGTREHPDSHYQLDLSDIQQFADFLDQCEGFEIW